MDWQYILSIAPEELNEDEKDDLYRTVTWHNLKNESLTLEKCIAFIKICQEVLKFKGEQVEVLLHKLDELATQQGEEEGRQYESDTDAKSSKSRKSSTLEFEHLEHKYLELRSKYKKQLKINEKNSTEMTKYQKKLAEVEQDKNRLINELQLINQDDNKSDISENAKEQHKELVNTLHTKNKQLSDLLRDIEITEHENIILREKLATVRDELSVATKELNVLTENLKASKVELDDLNETNKRLTAEKDNLQEEMNDILSQKRQFEQEMEEFTEEVNVRVDEWKRILEDKEKEIFELRSRPAPLSSNHSSLSSLPIDPNQVTTLNKILVDREKQLIDLKTKLEDAIKEMEETTHTIKNLKEENSKYNKKIIELEQVVKELKKQMKSSHERCQDLQDDLAYNEQAFQDKEQEIQTIIDKLKNEEQIDTSEILQKNQQLKSQNRTQEKQIMSLVKAANKLQDSCDLLEKENEVLRERLGIGHDDYVNTGTVSTKQKQQKREIAFLKKQILQLEDDKLELKLQKHQSQPESQNQAKALAEENEALRCGMHEILNSIKSKKEIQEVKSETLEKLLRALDVKHISGWYHPAMRLQAELHNQEGINSELREQLRLVRLESHSRSSTERSNKDATDYSSIFEADAASLDQIQNKLQNLFQTLQIDSKSDIEIEGKLQQYKGNFEEIRSQLTVLYEEYDTEKQILNDKMSEYEERIGDLEETNTILKTKIELLMKESSNDEILTRSLELAEDNVILIRKRVYLQTEIERLTNRIANLENELSEGKVGWIQKISELTKKNKSLSNTTEILTNQLKFAVSSTEHEQLQQKLEDLILKHRNLLHNFNQIGEKQEFEIKMFEEMRRNFKKEKIELENKIINLSEILYSQETENSTSSDLSKKLAISEANEVRERQRANHTNNLFELVKEQLQKSEERLSEINKYNKEVREKHVVLQEQLKDAENKLITYVDLDTYKAFQTKYNELLQNNTKLNEKNIEIESDLAQIKTSTELKSYHDYQKNQQLLELKHQIVDLQANNDEKVQIARLASDLTYCRLQQTDSNKKIEELTQKLSDKNRKCETLIIEIEDKKLKIAEKDNEMARKVGMFRDLLIKSKLQYLGCVPLPSEEKYVFNIKQAILDKHDAFLALYNAQITSNEALVLKDQYETGYQNVKKLLKSTTIDSANEIMMVFQDKKHSQFNEIKYRRQSALKETQLQHVFDRVKIQDEQIIKLEEELFALHKNFAFDFDPESLPILPTTQSSPELHKNAVKSMMKHKEIQTETVVSNESASYSSNNEIVTKDEIIQQLKSKVTESEMSLSLFRNQLGDKQSQITFYEKHILELQSKLEGVPKMGEDTTENGNEIMTLKISLKAVQDSVKQKEDEILNYQSLLKEDRDKHSMAATLMREELKVLQKCLSEEKQKVSELRTATVSIHSNKLALEQYFNQVHSVENELSDLRTKYSSLESQLLASRQESVRWRALANDRLETMQKLGKDLEDLHRHEITAYKNETEKWRTEVCNLKQTLVKYKTEIVHDSDLNQIIKEKDEKIHELSVIIRHAKSDARKQIEKSDSESITKLSELETTKEQLMIEHETIKRRFDQLLARERGAREEIRELKGKLLKKPILSARSDKTEKSVKEQLQKKISTLEKENDELKQSLAQQISFNEAHRLKASDDFNRWNKQKYYQQLSDKLKTKLKNKEADFEKVQETCAGYRILIERIEREKYNLEMKIKNLKSNNMNYSNTELEMLRLENLKLISENEALSSRLEMQHHHSGGLGAAMLQEKLEAQERKIAILELAAKGTAEVRAELERLQNTISSLQKSNLCLEAENLELKLDLEKSTKETPYLREQIHHLENYIKVLKKENTETSNLDSNPRTDCRKISELERTIFVLKRVVEKLQAENKRLLTGKRIYPDRSEKNHQENQRLKEQYCEGMKKIAKLETEIKDLKLRHNERIASSDELEQVKRELEEKRELLNRIKILLQRAAAKEKALLDEIDELKLHLKKSKGTASV